MKKETLAKLQSNFDLMAETSQLMTSSISGEDLWNIYLSSFKNDEIFKSKASHDCNNCKHFITHYGKIVAIDDDLNIITMFDNYDIEDEYKDSFNEMSKVIKNYKILHPFVITKEELIHKHNYEHVKNDKPSYLLGVESNNKIYTKEEAADYPGIKVGYVYKFDHLCVRIPHSCIKQYSLSGKSVDTIVSENVQFYQVNKRGLDTISIETANTVVDLIEQGSLLNAESQLSKLNDFIKSKIEYDRIPDNKKELYLWKNHSNTFKKHVSFRNELIGVLCQEIQESDINLACINWNKRVDPINYMKAKSPITKSQLNEAKKFVEKNGYEDSFNRRFATIDDIKASEILHMNSSERKNVSIFDSVESKVSKNKMNFDKVEEVPIDKFMNDILPKLESVEVYLTNKNIKNLCTLTTSVNKDSKRLFKWDNNYSWTFANGLSSTSKIADSVQTLGGKIDGVMRFSISWAENGYDNSDLDAHCIERIKNAVNEISFANKCSRLSSGKLDVDIRHPSNHNYKNVVENITYDKLEDGKYEFFVNNYWNRGSVGFSAEIEIMGEIYNYKYDKSLRQNENVRVAEITVTNGIPQISHLLKESTSSMEVYGISTNEFHKVNLVCLSPNYWDDNASGNKHYMFMIENCICDKEINSFHVENCSNDLLKHRKVLEILASTNKISSDSNNQLSGLGFNSTVRDELVVRCKGSFNRIIKLKF